MAVPVVTLGGTDISGYLVTAEYSDDIEAIDKLKLSCAKSIVDAVDISVGAAVVVTISGTTLFTGYVSKYDRQVNLIIRCDSEAAILARTRIDESYTNKRVDEIVTDIIDNYTSFTSTNVDTTTGVTLTTYRADGTLYEVIEEMAALMKWQWYVSADGNDFYFQPQGTDVYGTTFQTGSGGNCEKVGKWKFDDKRMVNYVICEGDRRNIQTYETFNGDASTVQFTLSYKPVGGVRVIVDSTEQVGGVDRIISSYDYTVDKDNKQINFESGSTPGVGVDNVEVYYQYSIPTKIIAQNDASIAAYGRYEDKEVNRNLQTVDDVKQHANKYLDKFSEPFESGSFKTRIVDPSLRAGALVTVIDDTPGINDTFVVKEVTVNWGKKKGLHSVLQVGTEEYKMYDWTKHLALRIREIEKQLRDASDLTVYLRNINDTLGVGAYLSYKTRTIGNSFILGHATNGTLGTGNGNVLGSDHSAYSAYTRNYTYQDITDDTYEDTSETTADWNASTGKITAG